MSQLILFNHTRLPVRIRQFINCNNDWIILMFLILRIIII